ncbi:hypothetical protein CPB85DRAFT_1255824 [Mucidula mucida]|nr:hypothetical protein CPB85DRAFT_1255824 [Mucidula mucida]
MANSKENQVPSITCKPSSDTPSGAKSNLEVLGLESNHNQNKHLKKSQANKKKKIGLLSLDDSRQKLVAEAMAWHKELTIRGINPVFSPNGNELKLDPNNPVWTLVDSADVANIKKNHDLIAILTKGHVHTFQFVCSLANWEDEHKDKKQFNTDPWSSVYNRILSGLRRWETYCQGIG